MIKGCYFVLNETDPQNTIFDEMFRNNRLKVEILQKVTVSEAGKF